MAFKFSNLRKWVQELPEAASKAKAANKAAKTAKKEAQERLLKAASTPQERLGYQFGRYVAQPVSKIGGGVVKGGALGLMGMAAVGIGSAVASPFVSIHQNKKRKEAENQKINDDAAKRVPLRDLAEEQVKRRMDEGMSESAARRLQHMEQVMPSVDYSSGQYSAYDEYQKAMSRQRSVEDAKAEMNRQKYGDQFDFYYGGYGFRQDQGGGYLGGFSEENIKHMIDSDKESFDALMKEFSSTSNDGSSFTSTQTLRTKGHSPLRTFVDQITEGDEEIAKELPKYFDRSLANANFSRFETEAVSDGDADAWRKLARASYSVTDEMLDQAVLGSGTADMPDDIKKALYVLKFRPEMAKEEGLSDEQITMFENWVMASAAKLMNDETVRNAAAGRAEVEEFQEMIKSKQYASAEERRRDILILEAMVNELNDALMIASTAKDPAGGLDYYGNRTDTPLPFVPSEQLLPGYKHALMDSSLQPTERDGWMDWSKIWELAKAGKPMAAFEELFNQKITKAVVGFVDQAATALVIQENQFEMGKLLEAHARSKNIDLSEYRSPDRFQGGNFSGDMLSEMVDRADTPQLRTGRYILEGVAAELGITPEEVLMSEETREMFAIAVGEYVKEVMPNTRSTGIQPLAINIVHTVMRNDLTTEQQLASGYGIFALAYGDWSKTPMTRDMILETADQVKMEIAARRGTDAELDRWADTYNAVSGLGLLGNILLDKGDREQEISDDYMGGMVARGMLGALTGIGISKNPMAGVYGAAAYTVMPVDAIPSAEDASTAIRLDMDGAPSMESFGEMWARRSLDLGETEAWWHTLFTQAPRLYSNVLGEVTQAVPVGNFIGLSSRAFNAKFLNVAGEFLTTAAQIMDEKGAIVQAATQQRDVVMQKIRDMDDETITHLAERIGTVGGDDISHILNVLKEGERRYTPEENALISAVVDELGLAENSAAASSDGFDRSQRMTAVFGGTGTRKRAIAEIMFSRRAQETGFDMGMLDYDSLRQLSDLLDSKMDAGAASLVDMYMHVSKTKSKQGLAVLNVDRMFGAMQRLFEVSGADVAKLSEETVQWTGAIAKLREVAYGTINKVAREGAVADGDHLNVLRFAESVRDSMPDELGVALVGALDILQRGADAAIDDASLQVLKAAKETINKYMFQVVVENGAVRETIPHVVSGHHPKFPEAKDWVRDLSMQAILPKEVKSSVVGHMKEYLDAGDKAYSTFRAAANPEEAAYGIFEKFGYTSRREANAWNKWIDLHKRIEAGKVGEGEKAKVLSEYEKHIRTLLRAPTIEFMIDSGMPLVGDVKTVDDIVARAVQAASDRIDEVATKAEEAVAEADAPLLAAAREVVDRSEREKAQSPIFGDAGGSAPGVKEFAEADPDGKFVRKKASSGKWTIAISKDDDASLYHPIFPELGSDGKRYSSKAAATEVIRIVGNGRNAVNYFARAEAAASSISPVKSHPDKWNPSTPQNMLGRVEKVQELVFDHFAKKEKTPYSVAAAIEQDARTAEEIVDALTPIVKPDLGSSEDELLAALGTSEVDAAWSDVKTPAGAIIMRPLGDGYVEINPGIPRGAIDLIFFDIFGDTLKDFDPEDAAAKLIEHVGDPSKSDEAREQVSMVIGHLSRMARTAEENGFGKPRNRLIKMIKSDKRLSAEGIGMTTVKNKQGKNVTIVRPKWDYPEYSRMERFYDFRGTLYHESQFEVLPKIDGSNKEAVKLIDDAKPALEDKGEIRGPEEMKSGIVPRRELFTYEDKFLHRVEAGLYRVEQNSHASGDKGLGKGKPGSIHIVRGRGKKPWHFEIRFPTGRNALDGIEDNRLPVAAFSSLKDAAVALEGWFDIVVALAEESPEFRRALPDEFKSRYVKTEQQKAGRPLAEAIPADGDEVALDALTGGTGKKPAAMEAEAPPTTGVSTAGRVVFTSLELAGRQDTRSGEFKGVNVHIPDEMNDGLVEFLLSATIDGNSIAKQKRGEIARQIVAASEASGMSREDVISHALYVLDQVISSDDAVAKGLAVKIKKSFVASARRTNIPIKTYEPGYMFGGAAKTAPDAARMGKIVVGGKEVRVDTAKASAGQIRVAQRLMSDLISDVPYIADIALRQLIDEFPTDQEQALKALTFAARVASQVKEATGNDVVGKRIKALRKQYKEVVSAYAEVSESRVGFIADTQLKQLVDSGLSRESMSVSQIAERAEYIHQSRKGTDDNASAMQRLVEVAGVTNKLKGSKAGSKAEIQVYEDVVNEDGFMVMYVSGRPAKKGYGPVDYHRNIVAAIREAIADGRSMSEEELLEAAFGDMNRTSMLDMDMFDTVLESFRDLPSKVMTADNEDYHKILWYLSNVVERGPHSTSWAPSTGSVKNYLTGGYYRDMVNNNVKMKKKHKLPLDERVPGQRISTIENTERIAKRVAQMNREISNIGNHLTKMKKGEKYARYAPNDGHVSRNWLANHVASIVRRTIGDQAAALRMVEQKGDANLFIGGVYPEILKTINGIQDTNEKSLAIRQLYAAITNTDPKKVDARSIPTDEQILEFEKLVYSKLSNMSGPSVAAWDKYAGRTAEDVLKRPGRGSESKLEMQDDGAGNVELDNLGYDPYGNRPPAVPDIVEKIQKTISAYSRSGKNMPLDTLYNSFIDVLLGGNAAEVEQAASAILKKIDSIPAGSSRLLGAGPGGWQDAQAFAAKIHSLHMSFENGTLELDHGAGWFQHLFVGKKRVGDDNRFEGGRRSHEFESALYAVAKDSSDKIAKADVAPATIEEIDYDDISSIAELISSKDVTADDEPINVEEAVRSIDLKLGRTNAKKVEYGKSRYGADISDEELYARPVMQNSFNRITKRVSDPTELSLWKVQIEKVARRSMKAVGFFADDIRAAGDDLTEEFLRGRAVGWMRKVLDNPAIKPGELLGAHNEIYIRALIDDIEAMEMTSKEYEMIAWALKETIEPSNRVSGPRSIDYRNLTIDEIKKEFLDAVSEIGPILSGEELAAKAIEAKEKGEIALPESVEDMFYNAVRRAAYERLDEHMDNISKLSKLEIEIYLEEEIKNSIEREIVISETLRRKGLEDNGMSSMTVRGVNKRLAELKAMAQSVDKELGKMMRGDSNFSGSDTAKIVFLHSLPGKIRSEIRRANLDLIILRSRAAKKRHLSAGKDQAEALRALNELEELGAAIESRVKELQRAKANDEASSPYDRWAEEKKNELREERRESSREDEDGDGYNEADDFEDEYEIEDFSERGRTDDEGFMRSAEGTWLESMSQLWEDYGKSAEEAEVTGEIGMSANALKKDRELRINRGVTTLESKINRLLAESDNMDTNVLRRAVEEMYAEGDHFNDRREFRDIMLAMYANWQRAHAIGDESAWPLDVFVNQIGPYQSPKHKDVDAYVTSMFAYKKAVEGIMRHERGFSTQIIEELFGPVTDKETYRRNVAGVLANIALIFRAGLAEDPNDGAILAHRAFVTHLYNTGMWQLQAADNAVKKASGPQMHDEMASALSEYQFTMHQISSTMSIMDEWMRQRASGLLDPADEAGSIGTARVDGKVFEPSYDVDFFEFAKKSGKSFSEDIINMLGDALGNAGVKIDMSSVSSRIIDGDTGDIVSSMSQLTRDASARVINDVAVDLRSIGIENIRAKSPQEAAIVVINALARNIMKVMADPRNLGMEAKDITDLWKYFEGVGMGKFTESERQAIIENFMKRYQFDRIGGPLDKEQNLSYDQVLNMLRNLTIYHRDQLGVMLDWEWDMLMKRTHSLSDFFANMEADPMAGGSLFRSNMEQRLPTVPDESLHRTMVQRAEDRAAGRAAYRNRLAQQDDIPFAGGEYQSLDRRIGGFSPSEEIEMLNESAPPWYSFEELSKMVDGLVNVDPRRSIDPDMGIPIHGTTRARIGEQLLELDNLVQRFSEDGGEEFYAKMDEIQNTVDRALASASNDKLMMIAADLLEEYMAITMVADYLNMRKNTHADEFSDVIDDIFSSYTKEDASIMNDIIPTFQEAYEKVLDTLRNGGLPESAHGDLERPLTWFIKDEFIGDDLFMRSGQSVTLLKGLTTDGSTGKAFTLGDIFKSGYGERMYGVSTWNIIKGVEIVAGQGYSNSVMGEFDTINNVIVMYAPNPLVARLYRVGVENPGGMAELDTAFALMHEIQHAIDFNTFSRHAADYMTGKNRYSTRVTAEGGQTGDVDLTSWGEIRQDVPGVPRGRVVAMPSSLEYRAESGAFLTLMQAALVDREFAMFRAASRPSGPMPGISAFVDRLNDTGHRLISESMVDEVVTEGTWRISDRLDSLGRLGSKTGGEVADDVPRTAMGGIEDMMRAIAGNAEITAMHINKGLVGSKGNPRKIPGLGVEDPRTKRVAREYGAVLTEMDKSTLSEQALLTSLGFKSEDYGFLKVDNPELLKLVEVNTKLFDATQDMLDVGRVNRDTITEYTSGIADGAVGKGMERELELIAKDLAGTRYGIQAKKLLELWRSGEDMNTLIGEGSSLVVHDVTGQTIKSPEQLVASEVLALAMQRAGGDFYVASAGALKGNTYAQDIFRWIQNQWIRSGMFDLAITARGAAVGSLSSPAGSMKDINRKVFGPISAEAMRIAHRRVDSLAKNVSAQVAIEQARSSASSGNDARYYVDPEAQRVIGTDGARSVIQEPDIRSSFRTAVVEVMRDSALYTWENKSGNYLEIEITEDGVLHKLNGRDMYDFIDEAAEVPSELGYAARDQRFVILFNGLSRMSEANGIPVLNDAGAEALLARLEAHHQNRVLGNEKKLAGITLHNTMFNEEVNAALKANPEKAHQIKIQAIKDEFAKFTSVNRSNNVALAARSLLKDDTGAILSWTTQFWEHFTTIEVQDPYRRKMLLGEVGGGKVRNWLSGGWRGMNFDKRAIGVPENVVFTTSSASSREASAGTLFQSTFATAKNWESPIEAHLSYAGDGAPQKVAGREGFRRSKSTGKMETGKHSKERSLAKMVQEAHESMGYLNGGPLTPADIAVKSDRSWRVVNDRGIDLRMESRPGATAEELEAEGFVIYKDQYGYDRWLKPESKAEIEAGQTGTQSIGHLDVKEGVHETGGATSPLFEVDPEYAMATITLSEAKRHMVLDYNRMLTMFSQFGAKMQRYSSLKNPYGAYIFLTASIANELDQFNEGNRIVGLPVAGTVNDKKGIPHDGVIGVSPSARGSIDVPFVHDPKSHRFIFGPKEIREQTRVLAMGQASETLMEVGYGLAVEKPSYAMMNDDWQFMADVLNDAGKFFEMGAFSKFYRQFVLPAITRWRLTFHWNNKMGNTMNMLRSPYDVKKFHREAHRIMFGLMNGTLDVRSLSPEWRDAIEYGAVPIQSTFAGTESSAGESGGLPRTTVMDKVFNTEFARSGRAMMATVEGGDRMALFMAARDAGLPKQSAADAVDYYLYDYSVSNLKPMEQGLRTGFSKQKGTYKSKTWWVNMPFYTFTKRNLGFQYKELKRDPIGSALHMILLQRMYYGMGDNDMRESYEDRFDRERMRPGIYWSNEHGLTGISWDDPMFAAYAIARHGAGAVDSGFQVLKDAYIAATDSAVSFEDQARRSGSLDSLTRHSMGLAAKTAGQLIGPGPTSAIKLLTTLMKDYNRDDFDSGLSGESRFREDQDRLMYELGAAMPGGSVINYLRSHPESGVGSRVYGKNSHTRGKAEHAAGLVLSALGAPMPRTTTSEQAERQRMADAAAQINRSRGHIEYELKHSSMGKRNINNDSVRRQIREQNKVIPKSIAELIMAGSTNPLSADEIANTTVMEESKQFLKKYNREDALQNPDWTGGLNERSQFAIEEIAPRIMQDRIASSMFMDVLREAAREDYESRDSIKQFDADKDGKLNESEALGLIVDRGTLPRYLEEVIKRHTKAMALTGGTPIVTGEEFRKLTSTLTSTVGTYDPTENGGRVFWNQETGKLEYVEPRKPAKKQGVDTNARWNNSALWKQLNVRF